MPAEVQKSLIALSLPAEKQIARLAKIFRRPIESFGPDDAVDELLIDFEEDLVGFRSERNIVEMMQKAPAISICIKFLEDYFPDEDLLSVDGLVRSKEWEALRGLAALAAKELEPFYGPCGEFD